MTVRNEVFFYQLEGLRELDQMLKELPKTMAKSVLRNACKKALIPVRDLARKTAPRGGTGDFSESIEIGTKLNKHQKRSRKRPGPQEVEVFVGSTSSLGHLVEWGTRQRVRESGGATGEMPADPFFSRAWNAKKKTVFILLKKELATELMKGVARLRKRAEAGKLSRKMAQEIL